MKDLTIAELYQAAHLLRKTPHQLIPFEDLPYDERLAYENTNPSIPHFTERQLAMAEKENIETVGIMSEIFAYSVRTWEELSDQEQFFDNFCVCLKNSHSDLVDEADNTWEIYKKVFCSHRGALNNEKK